MIFHYYSQAALEEFKYFSRLTGCLAPCSYFHAKKYGDPVLTPSKYTTFYFFTLASTRIKVFTEHRFPDFPSLVADIGGTLGLFLGFSFLMVWDSLFEWIVITNYKIAWQNIKVQLCKLFGISV